MSDLSGIELQNPAPATNVSKVDVPEQVLLDLLLRRILLDGESNIIEMSTRLGLSNTIVDNLVTNLNDRRLINALVGDGRNRRFELTEDGRTTAKDRTDRCTYAGVAPVSLGEYRATIDSQQITRPVSRELLRKSMTDLVLDEALLDQLGPSLNSTGAVFLYGPPGTGKTSLAERMIRVHNDPVLVPYAVEVDGQIITVFDPVVHELYPDGGEVVDQRWAVCRRPCVVAGGEMTAAMLDLSHDATSGISTAPLQMKANNGIMVVDDFGRQMMTPEELLNRWIVPLGSRIDYLALNSGFKFSVPFEVNVVFSTNLDPGKLGDEAFFRRIQNKIFVGPITEQIFDWILSRVAAALEIPATQEAAQYMRHLCRTKGDHDLRPYQPKELCQMLKAVCTYEGVPPEMSREYLDRAAELYFAEDFSEDKLDFHDD
jgi:DNA-binding MarR family transcriptional regulator